MNNYYLSFLFLIILAGSSGLTNQKVETVYLPPVTLSRTPMGRHVQGDEELKRISSTDLTGTISLIIKNGGLVAVLSATILEDDGDRTKFLIYNEYPLYTPPLGFHIVGFKVMYSINTASGFHYRQRNYGPQVEGCLDGPVSTVIWEGDRGDSDQDQIHGCWLETYLRRIRVNIEKS